MFEIGASLREAREQRGIDLAQAEAATLIGRRHLAALENEHWSVISGEFYVRSFLREYAEFLGLDGDLYVEEYLVHVPPPPAPEPEPRRRTRHLSVTRPDLVLGAALAVGGAVWGLGNTTNRSTGVSEPAPLNRVEAKPKPAPPQQPVAHTLPRARSLSITASRGRCWLSVRIGSREGRLVAERTLELGQTARFGLGRALWIRLGAARNVDLAVGARAVGPLSAGPVNVIATSSGVQPA